MWLLGAIVILVGLVAYGVWSTLATRTDLLRARASAEGLQRALAEQNDEGSTRALRTLQSSFSKAHDRTDGPLWGIGTALPDDRRRCACRADRLRGGR